MIVLLRENFGNGPAHMGCLAFSCDETEIHCIVPVGNSIKVLLHSFLCSGLQQKFDDISEPVSDNDESHSWIRCELGPPERSLEVLHREPLPNLTGPWQHILRNLFSNNNVPIQRVTMSARPSFSNSAMWIIWITQSKALLMSKLQRSADLPSSAHWDAVSTVVRWSVWHKFPFAKSCWTFNILWARFMWIIKDPLMSLSIVLLTMLVRLIGC